MSQATTAASASESEPHDSWEPDTNNVDLKSQPIVIAWKSGQGYSTTRRSKADFTLDLHWNPSRNKAFLKLSTTLALKNNKGKTHVYLFIPPERIHSLSVGTSEIPPPDEFASNPDHICFRFDLQGPANFVGPKIALRPRDSSSGTTLDCIRALAIQTTFEVHTAITPRNLPRWKLDLFRDTFKFPNHGVRSIDGHARMTDLYGGRGGRVIEVEISSEPDERPKTATISTTTNPVGEGTRQDSAADEPSPPSYDELALSPPSYGGDPSRMSSKRRRLESISASNVEKAGRSTGKDTAKHPAGESDKPENSPIAQFIGDGLDKLPSACTARLVSSILKEFDGDRRARLVVPVFNRLKDERIVDVLDHLANTLHPDQLGCLWGHLQELGPDRFDAIFLRLYTQLDDENLHRLGQAHQQIEPHSAPAKSVESHPNTPLDDRGSEPVDGRLKLIEFGIITLIRQQLCAQLDSALPRMVSSPSASGTGGPEELRDWVEDKLEELKYWYECQFESVESDVMDFVRDQVSDVFDERLADLDPAFGELVRTKIREAFGNATIALQIEE